MADLTDEQALALPPAGTNPPAATPPVEAAAPQQPAPPANMTDAQALAMPPVPGAARGNEALALEQSAHPVASNFATGIARIPGAVIGAPEAINHMAHGGLAWLLNKADGGARTADTIDAALGGNYGLMGPKASTVDNAVVKGMDKLDNAVGAPQFKPYQPVTLPGKVGQAVVTAAGAGAFDPMADASSVGKLGQLWTALRNGAAGGTAELTADKIAPGSTIAPFLAAVATHHGLGMGGSTVASAYEAGVRPFLNPDAAGEAKAGAVMAQPNQIFGTANPSAADEAGALGDTQAATRTALSGAQDPGSAAEEVRGNLQDYLDAITAKAKQASDPLYAKFRQEPVPTTEADLQTAGLGVNPMVQTPRGQAANPNYRPALAPALGRGAGDVGNFVGGDGRTTSTQFNAAGDPQFVGGAFTPDLMQRGGVKLKAMAAESRESSPTDTQAAGGLTSLSSDLQDFLYNKYPSLKTADQAYAKGMEPAAGFSNPMVKNSMSRPPQKYGVQPPYYQQPQQLFDQIARARDPGTVMENYLGAAPNPQAVIEPIKEGIIGDLANKGVVSPNGEISADAYDKAVKPYLPTIGMYMPEIGKNFATAKTAQATLDNMRAQRGVAQDILSGGMRDRNEVVTGASATRWLARNDKLLQQTQTPEQNLRLKQIAAALGAAPGNTAQEIASKAVPAVAGAATFGTEGGVLGLLGVEDTVKAMTGGQLAKFHNAYSTAIERAVVDPVYAKRITDIAASRPRTVPNAQAIREAIQQQALAALRQGAISSAATQGQTNGK